MPADSEQRSISPRPTLDIVQDCADLADTFPENVNFNFVYWNHGSGDESPERYGRLVPYLEHANVIALEQPPIEHPDIEIATDQEFNIINQFIHGESSGNLREAYGNLQPTALLPEIISIAKGLQSARVHKRPFFVPLYTYHRQLIPGKERRGNPQDFLTRAKADAVYLRNGERTTLRQLHGYAGELAAKGSDQQIAVVKGAIHTPLSVATRMLGARTSRSFVDKPTMDPKDYITRLIRFGASDKMLAQELPVAETAYEAAIRLAILGNRLKIKALSDKYTAGFTTKRLGMYYLRYEKQVLSPGQQEAGRLLTHVEPYAYKKLLPHFGRREELKKSLEALITLAAA